MKSPRRSIIPIFVPHLGCPHDCVFCNQRRISGQTEPATPASTRREVEQALERCGRAEQIAFYGGSFTAIPEQQQTELLESVQEFLEDGSVGSLRVSTRPDCIDASVISRLLSYGVKTVELGVQSLDDRVLLASGRGHTARDAAAASHLVKDAGLELILQMMTGLPASNDESDVETARGIIALSPNGVRIYPTVIIRDTPLYELYKSGAYREHTVEDAVRVCAKIVPEFEAAGIAIIRLGLNPSDSLSGGDAVAGAYHPALGELVQGEIMLGRARSLLARHKNCRDAALSVRPELLSRTVGQHRRNVDALVREFNLESLKIYPCAGQTEDIILVRADGADAAFSD